MDCHFGNTAFEWWFYFFVAYSGTATESTASTVNCLILEFRTEGMYPRSCYHIFLKKAENFMKYI